MTTGFFIFISVSIFIGGAAVFGALWTLLKWIEYKNGQ